MGFFDQVVIAMAEIGMDLFLPWLMILAISYGILDKYEVISSEAQVNGTVAISFAFLVIIGAHSFVPAGMWSQFAANIAFGVFGLLALLILLAVAGYDLNDMGDEWSLPWIFGGVIAVVSFIGVLIQFGDAGALIGPGENLFDQVVMPILTLIFLIAVIAITTQE